MKVSIDGDNLVVVEIDQPIGPYHMAEELTPLEAERLAKELQEAARKARQANRPKVSIGDH
jgi:hypothetical protein